MESYKQFNNLLKGLSHLEKYPLYKESRHEIYDVSTWSIITFRKNLPQRINKYKAHTTECEIQEEILLNNDCEEMMHIPVVFQANMKPIEDDNNKGDFNDWNRVDIEPKWNSLDLAEYILKNIIIDTMKI